MAEATLKELVDAKTGKRYLQQKLLGTGGFGKCFEAVGADDGQLYALKAIPKKSVSERRHHYKLLTEIKLHRSLKHPHIVEFLHAFEDKEAIYMVLEHCRNYTLKDLVKRRKRLAEVEARVYVWQIAHAIDYIHRQGVIHRDLKLGNVLLNSRMETKLCDFGLSTRVRHEGDLRKTLCGTPNYIAPEIVDESGHSYEVDIWAIGVCLYTFLFGKPPFEDRTVEDTYENIKKNNYSIPRAIAVSPDAIDLIQKILVVDPKRRLALADLFEHPFMRGSHLPLPISSLAVPPPDRAESEASVPVVESIVESELASPRPAFAGVCVLECFVYKNSLGYLLSSGVVGTLELSSSRCLLLEFGDGCYFEGWAKTGLTKVVARADSSEDEGVRLLAYFRSYFVTKHTVFKLDELQKRSAVGDIVFVRKALCCKTGEVAVRLSNGVVQLQLADFTMLVAEQGGSGPVSYLNERGKLVEGVEEAPMSAALARKVSHFRAIFQREKPTREQ